MRSHANSMQWMGGEDIYYRPVCSAKPGGSHRVCSGGGAQAVEVVRTTTRLRNSMTVPGLLDFFLFFFWCFLFPASPRLTTASEREHSAATACATEVAEGIPYTAQYIIGNPSSWVARCNSPVLGAGGCRSSGLNWTIWDETR